MRIENTNVDRLERKGDEHTTKSKMKKMRKSPQKNVIMAIEMCGHGYNYDYDITYHRSNTIVSNIFASRLVHCVCVCVCACEGVCIFLLKHLLYLVNLYSEERRWRIDWGESSGFDEVFFFAFSSVENFSRFFMFRSKGFISFAFLLLHFFIQVTPAATNRPTETPISWNTVELTKERVFTCAGAKQRIFVV